MTTSWGYAVIDYILLVGEANKGPASVIARHYSDRIKSEYETSQAGSLVRLPPSRRELVVDAMGLDNGGSWTATSALLQKPFTNHRNGTLAAGSNIGFVDGHVEWRTVEKMKQMAGSSTPVARTSGAAAVFVW